MVVSQLLLLENALWSVRRNRAGGRREYYYACGALHKDSPSDECQERSKPAFWLFDEGIISRFSSGHHSEGDVLLKP